MEGIISSALLRVSKEVCLYLPAFGQWQGFLMGRYWIYLWIFKEPDIFTSCEPLKVVCKPTDCLWTGEENEDKTCQSVKTSCPLPNWAGGQDFKNHTRWVNTEFILEDRSKIKTSLQPKWWKLPALCQIGLGGRPSRTKQDGQTQNLFMRTDSRKKTSL